MIGPIFRHSGVLISLGILGMTAVVLTIVGILMARSGASLRPIVWFAGLVLLVVAPQLVVHTYDAIRLARLDAPHAAALDAAPGRSTTEPDLSAIDERPEALEQLFGPDVDPRLVIDVRTSWAAVLGDAEVARFAALPSGESVMLARFGSERDAEKAWAAYLASSGLRAVASGDERRGFVASRPAGDRVYVLPMRTMFGVWSGSDDATIRARIAAGGFPLPHDAPLGGAIARTRAGSDAAGAGRPGAAIEPATLTNDVLPLWANLTILIVMLGIVVPYMFKGAAWAAAVPRAAVAPVSPDALRERLLAINELDVPFAVAAEPGSDIIEVTWRYADAKWVDHARVHGMQRTHRIVLRLDDRSRVARVTDYAASFDWSAGVGDVRIQWKAAMGINFFEARHGRVFGMQLGPDGAFTPDRSYAYRFNVQEMKAPLISAVTGAGWEWKPVLWGDAPPWLRWLTE